MKVMYDIYFRNSNYDSASELDSYDITGITDAYDKDEASDKFFNSFGFLGEWQYIKCLPGECMSFSNITHTIYEPMTRINISKQKEFFFITEINDTESRILNKLPFEMLKKLLIYPTQECGEYCPAIPDWYYLNYEE